MLPGNAAREEETRHVDTGDGQEQRHSDRYQIQAGADPLDHVRGQGDDPDPQLGLVENGASQAFGDGVHLRLRP